MGITKKIVKQSNKIIRTQAKNTQDLPKELATTKTNKSLKKIINKGL